MFNSFFNFILSGIGEILGGIINFFTAPILRLLSDTIPNFSSFFTTASNFITTYLLKGFQWVKMSFIHIANINTSVFNLFVISIGFLIAIYGLILGFKLAYNVWSIFHGSQSKN